MKPTEKKNLSWKDAWWYLLNGERIKRPLWEGYWEWENNTIMMHCRDGSVVDIRETDFVAYTFSNIAQRDWMVVEEPIQKELEPVTCRANTLSDAKQILCDAVDTLGAINTNDLTIIINHN